ncbi:MAG: ribonuclease J [Alphaproteobacteria bacterium]|nr:MAG: ribonuclease J [Alphaproteobacteria bacterium]
MTDRLIYLPLGGAGEIGMNAYVYGYGPQGQERFLLVDLGVTFPEMAGTPGVDLIMADIAWLEKRADRLEGIVITHAHEDHVGALPHLWRRLKAPVHARPFTGHIARMKMGEAGLDPAHVVIVDKYPRTVQLGPFEVAFLPVAHSIPESSALLIETPAGRIIHTGDFKLDQGPVVGEPWDPELWRSASKGETRALVCDSTNVFTDHPGRSESTLAEPITELVREAKGMVVATTFASNIARLKTLAEAGRAAGRSVVLLGRAMRRMLTAAEETGVLSDFPGLVSPEDAADIPRENLMVLATGSQGERRAATAQLARGRYMGIELAEGDLFLFSSKTIPGNERAVIRILNALSEKGVDVVDDHTDRYHVSGHANRPDLATVQEIVNPRMVIPMHGEHRHLRAHAALAAELGRASAIVPNGTMVELSGEAPRVVEHVETGRLYLDGGVMVGAMDGVVRDRIRVALNGHVAVSVIIDEDGEPLGEPWVAITGLAETGRSHAPLADVLEHDLDQMLKRADPRTLADDDRLTEALTRALRQSAMSEIGKKPEVSVIISRLG